MMLSTANLLSPADGSPVVAPTQDMVLGCYYLTMDPPELKGKAAKNQKIRTYGSEEEAILAYQLREKTNVTLHEPIDARSALGRGSRTSASSACGPRSAGSSSTRSCRTGCASATRS